MRTDSQMPRCDVLLITATDVEESTLLEQAEKRLGAKAKTVLGRRRTYMDLGTLGDARVLAVRSEMGGSTVGGALPTTLTAVEELRPHAIIMVGIAFGIDPNTQPIGQVLVSRQIQAYELQRVGKGEPDAPGTFKIVLRGDKVTASPVLLARFRTAVHSWPDDASRPHDAESVKACLLLSGEKLIDDQDYRDQLLKLVPEARGGEMEGAGLYAATRERETPWILVKAVSDWADGNKHRDKKERRRTAARRAVDFVLHTLEQGGFSAARWMGPAPGENDPLEYPHATARVSLQWMGPEEPRQLEQLAELGNDGTIARAFGGLQEGDVIQVSSLGPEANGAIHLYRQRHVEGQVWRLQHWGAATESDRHRRFVREQALADTDACWFARVEALTPGPGPRAPALCMGPVRAKRVSLLSQRLRTHLDVMGTIDIFDRLFARLGQVSSTAPVLLDQPFDFLTFYGPQVPDGLITVLDIDSSPRPHRLDVVGARGLDVPETISLRMHGGYVLGCWPDLRQSSDRLVFCRFVPESAAVAVELVRLATNAQPVAVREQEPHGHESGSAPGDDGPDNVPTHDTTTRRAFTIRQKIERAAALHLKPAKQEEFTIEAARICRHFGRQASSCALALAHGDLCLERLLVEERNESGGISFKVMSYGALVSKAPITKDHASLEASLWSQLAFPIASLDALAQLFLRLSATTAIQQVHRCSFDDLTDHSQLQAIARVIGHVRHLSFEACIDRLGIEPARWWWTYHQTLYHEFVARLHADRSRDDSPLKHSLIASMAATVLDSEE